MSGGSVIGHGSTLRACNCIGPQGGQPLCPCRMRNVTIEGGRYRSVTDLGPVKIKFAPKETREQEIERLRKRLTELEAGE